MSLDPDFAAALAAHSMEIDEPIALRLQHYAQTLVLDPTGGFFKPSWRGRRKH